MTDPVTELHALAVLDVLEAAEQAVIDWRVLDWGRFDTTLARLDDALMRLDRLEVTVAAA